MAETRTVDKMADFTGISEKCEKSDKQDSIYKLKSKINISKICSSISANAIFHRDYDIRYMFCWLHFKCKHVDQYTRNGPITTRPKSDCNQIRPARCKNKGIFSMQSNLIWTPEINLVFHVMDCSKIFFFSMVHVTIGPIHSKLLCLAPIFMGTWPLYY